MIVRKEKNFPPSPRQNTCLLIASYATDIVATSTHSQAALRACNASRALAKLQKKPY